MGKKLLGKETGKLVIESIVIILVPVIFFSVIHEQRHKSIAESYGCKAEIDYIPEPPKYFMHTEWKNCNNLSEKQEIAFDLKQSNVETVGYQMIPLILIQIMGLVIMHGKYKAELRNKELIESELEKR